MDEFPWPHLITFLSMEEVRNLLQTRVHTEDYYQCARKEILRRYTAIQRQLQRVEARLRAARRELADAGPTAGQTQQRTRRRRQ